MLKRLQYSQPNLIAAFFCNLLQTLRHEAPLAADMSRDFY